MLEVAAVSATRPVVAAKAVAVRPLMFRQRALLRRLRSVGEGQVLRPAAAQSGRRAPTGPPRTPGQWAKPSPTRVRPARLPKKARPQQSGELVEALKWPPCRLSVKARLFRWMALMQEAWRLAWFPMLLAWAPKKTRWQYPAPLARVGTQLPWAGPVWAQLFDRTWWRREAQASQWPAWLRWPEPSGPISGDRKSAETAYRPRCRTQAANREPRKMVGRSA
jgi:hypothetical protein